MIRDVFTEGPKEHLDIAPEDVGMSPCDSWYREARQATANDSAATDSWSDKRLSAWNSMMGLGEAKLEGGVLLRQSYLGRPGFLASRPASAGRPLCAGLWSRCG